MTPNEINAKFTAESAKRRREIEDADRLAWLIGNYVAIGFHNPKGYPEKPIFYASDSTDTLVMTDDEMRAVMHDNMLRRNKACAPQQMEG